MSKENSVLITKKKADSIREQLTSQIAAFDRKRNNNKQKAFAIRIAVIGAGTLTTVMLGLSIPGIEQLSKNIALCLSAIATLLSAWESYFNHRELWLQYTATYTSLRALLADLEFQCLDLDEDYPESVSAVNEGLNKLFAQMQRALQETNNAWQTLRDEPKADKNH